MNVDLKPYWVDDDHVWRFDTDNPGPNDQPRAVGRLSDGWMLSDAVEIADSDIARAAENRQPCDCWACELDA